mgnify:FL=1|jgi:mRNA interferase MazF
MKEGDVILAAIPQSDGGQKIRPAIILRELPPYHDLLVCGVSTQLHHCVKDFDETISPQDSDFKLSGLLAKSLIRLGFLAVFPRNSIVGKIGTIEKERHNRLLKTIANHLVKNC